MKKLIVLFFVIFSLSCGHKINEGIVINKRCEAPKNYIRQTPVMSGKTIILIPMSYYDVGGFIVTIKGIDNDSNVIEEFRVTEENYEKIAIGDEIICK
jgi:hypothetical protein